MRQRRRRTAFTEEQLDRLEESFMEEKFPGIIIREQLAEELNIKEDRIQVWFQNRRSRWRRHGIKNKRHGTEEAASSIAHAPVFPPFCRRPQSAVPTWTFPASFIRPSTATALALKCKAKDRASPVIGSSSGPQADVMATGFLSSPSMIPTQLPYKPMFTNFPSSIRESRHSLDEYVAAVTLASGFLREH
ncbi:paired box protein Pax-6-like [Oculina patagonica]